MSTPIRVLLADDHAVVRAGIRQILQQAADIQVIAEAEDGEMAKQLIASQKPDVAVLDIQMPRATGVEVTRWIRARKETVGVLILTAYDDTPYVLGVLQAGANGFLLKTASPEQLIQAVRDVYRGKSILDATVSRKLIDHLVDPHRGQVYPHLTERELEVLRFVARGFTNKAIAFQLSISDRTVQGHLAHIYKKLQSSSRTEAVIRAISLGLIPQNIGQDDQI